MKLYICKSCGNIVKGQYRENPQYGSHYVVKCQCGKKGNSRMNHDYSIKGFEKKPRGSYHPENKS